MSLKCVSLEPTNQWRYLLVASYYSLLGLKEEADPWFAKAIALDSEAAVGHGMLALHRFSKGDTLMARASFTRFRELLQGQGPHTSDLNLRLAMLMADSEYQLAASQRLQESAPNSPYGAIYLGYVYERFGEGKRTPELLYPTESSALRLIDVSEDPMWPHALSLLAAVRGDSDISIRWLEDAYARGYRNHWWLSVDPAFHGIRGDKRFRAVLQRMRDDINVMRERVRREGLVRLPA